MSVCEALGITGNLLVWSRGPGQIHRRLVNEAGDVSEDMKMGRHFHVPALLFRKQKELVLDTLVRRCLSFWFPLFYSIGLQVGLLAL